MRSRSKNPVSYTHLDVYKRQVLDKTGAQTHEQDSLEVFIDEDNGKTASYGEDDKQYRICLLYTSRCV